MENLFKEILENKIKEKKLIVESTIEIIDIIKAILKGGDDEITKLLSNKSIKTLLKNSFKVSTDEQLISKLRSLQHDATNAENTLKIWANQNTSDIEKANITKNTDVGKLIKTITDQETLVMGLLRGKLYTKFDSYNFTRVIFDEIFNTFIHVIENKKMMFDNSESFFNEFSKQIDDDVFLAGVIDDLKRAGVSDRQLSVLDNKEFKGWLKDRIKKESTYPISDVYTYMHGNKTRIKQFVKARDVVVKRPIYNAVMNYVGKWGATFVERFKNIFEDEFFKRFQKDFDALQNEIIESLPAQLEGRVSEAELINFREKVKNLWDRNFKKTFSETYKEAQKRAYDDLKEKLITDLRSQHVSDVEINLFFKNVENVGIKGSPSIQDVYTALKNEVEQSAKYKGQQERALSGLEQNVIVSHLKAFWYKIEEGLKPFKAPEKATWVSKGYYKLFKSTVEKGLGKWIARAVDYTTFLFNKGMYAAAFGTFRTPNQLLLNISRYGKTFPKLVGGIIVTYVELWLTHLVIAPAFSFLGAWVDGIREWVFNTTGSGEEILDKRNAGKRYIDRLMNILNLNEMLPLEFRPYVYKKVWVDIVWESVKGVALWAYSGGPGLQDKIMKENENRLKNIINDDLDKLNKNVLDKKMTGSNETVGDYMKTKYYETYKQLEIRLNNLDQPVGKRFLVNNNLSKSEAKEIAKHLYFGPINFKTLDEARIWYKGIFGEDSNDGQAATFINKCLAKMAPGKLGNETEIKDNDNCLKIIVAGLKDNYGNLLPINSENLSTFEYLSSDKTKKPLKDFLKRIGWQNKNINELEAGIEQGKKDYALIQKKQELAKKRLDQAKKMGWNSWEEYKKSGWKLNKTPQQKLELAKKCGYNSWEEYKNAKWKCLAPKGSGSNSGENVKPKNPETEKTQQTTTDTDPEPILNGYIRNKNKQIMNEIIKKIIQEEEEKTLKMKDWDEIFTFQRSDEKNPGRFTDVKIKMDSVMDRMPHWRKKYKKECEDIENCDEDGEDDSFVRAVIDTHPEVVRILFTKGLAHLTSSEEQEDLNEGLISILSLIREAKNVEVEVWSVYRHPSSPDKIWSLVKGDYKPKELASMDVKMQKSPEGEVKKKINSLDELKKKESDAISLLSKDEKKGLLELPIKVREKVKEKIKKGWTTEKPSDNMINLFKKDEINSVLVDPISIYKLKPNQEFFKFLMDNKSTDNLKRGFCRAIYYVEKEIELSKEKESKIKDILNNCMSKFDGKYGQNYL